MIAYSGWMIGTTPISCQIIFSDSLYDRAVAQPNTPITLFNQGRVKSTYEEAWAALMQEVIPAFAVSNAQNGIPSGASRPYVADSHTSLSGPIGYVRPQLVTGTGSLQIKAPTGNNGPTISTTWSSSIKASTTMDYNAVTFPNVVSTVSKGTGSTPDLEEIVHFSVLPERCLTDGVYNGTSVIGVDVFIKLELEELTSTSYRANALVRLSVSNSSAITSTVTSTIGGVKAVDDSDPYSQGGESESESTPGSTYTGIGGGDGVYTNPDYTGGVPALPTLSAVDTGLIRLYCSSSAVGLNGLANYLWSSAFDIDTFKKLFADPMDLIFGASIIPCSPASTASTIIFGNVNTGVSMPQATSQYVSVDCGTIDLTKKRRYDTFLDYAPHTKTSIYLPYIGMRELNTTEIAAKTVGVVYHVDVLTGACVAFVTANGVVLYEFSGSCAVQIPITSNNWASVLQSLATIGGMALGGFAAGGPVGALVAGGAAAASNAASGGLTPSFQRGGSVSGSAGLLADQNPYLIREIPNMCKASGQNWFEGYPNYTTLKLDMCSGFTRVQSVHLEGIGCTATELNEIESLLKGGVVI